MCFLVFLESTFDMKVGGHGFGGAETLVIPIKTQKYQYNQKYH